MQMQHVPEAAVGWGSLCGKWNLKVKTLCSLKHFVSWYLQEVSPISRNRNVLLNHAGAEPPPAFSLRTSCLRTLSHSKVLFPAEEWERGVWKKVLHIAFFLYGRFWIRQSRSFIQLQFCLIWKQGMEMVDYIFPTCSYIATQPNINQ